MRDDETRPDVDIPCTEVPLTAAASMLGMTRAQVRMLLAQGVLQDCSIHGRHRIPVASIEAHKEAVRARSRTAMSDLADLQNELGLTE